MSVGNWLAKARSTFREFGPLDGTLFAFAALARRLTGRRVRLVKYYIYAQPIGRHAGPGLRPDPATVIAETPADSALTTAFPRPPAVIRNRYRQQAVCLAATVKDTFAGFIWFAWNRYEEDEVRCLYLLEDPRRCVWDFDVYVEPPFRVGRTLARLWDAADRHLAARGVQWSFSRISAFNPMSIAAHARLGAVKCHSVAFLVAGPLQVAFLPRAPFVHVSVSDRRPPRLRLRLPAIEAAR